MIRRILRAFVTAFVVLVLWIVKKTIDVAAEANSFIALVAGLAGFLGFLFSYLRHRSKCDELALEALRVANTPGTANKDWENLLDQSAQDWDKTRVLMDVFVGLLIWAITFSVSLFMETDHPEVTRWINIGIVVLGIYIWFQVKQEQERKQFENTLAAANAGRWFPCAEDSEADKSSRGKAKKFVSELPEQLLDGALKRFEDGLK